MMLSMVPDAALTNILSHLTMSHLAVCTACCKELSVTARDPKMWNGINSQLMSSGTIHFAPLTGGANPTQREDDFLCSVPAAMETAHPKEVARLFFLKQWRDLTTQVLTEKGIFHRGASMFQKWPVDDHQLPGFLDNRTIPSLIWIINKVDHVTCDCVVDKIVVIAVEVPRYTKMVAKVLVDVCAGFKQQSGHLWDATPSDLNASILRSAWRWLDRFAAFVGSDDWHEHFPVADDSSTTMRLMMAKDLRPWSSNQGPRLGIANLIGRLFARRVADPPFVERCAARLLASLEALPECSAEQRGFKSYPAAFLITAFCELLESGQVRLDELNAGQIVRYQETLGALLAPHRHLHDLPELVGGGGRAEAVPSNMRERIKLILERLEGNRDVFLGPPVSPISLKAEREARGEDAYVQGMPLPSNMAPSNKALFSSAKQRLHSGGPPLEQSTAGAAT